MKESRLAWGQPTGERQLAQRGLEICQLFNKPEGNKCSFKWCRYVHMCSRCRCRQHPAAECQRGNLARGGTNAPQERESRGPPAGAR